MVPSWARVDLRVMAMKRYSSFPKAPALLEPHHQIVLCHIKDTQRRSLTPLQGYSQCILQPQPTGLIWTIDLIFLVILTRCLVGKYFCVKLSGRCRFNPNNRFKTNKKYYKLNTCTQSWSTELRQWFKERVHFEILCVLQSLTWNTWRRQRDLLDKTLWV